MHHKNPLKYTVYFSMQNVALGLSIQQSIFDFLKMFGLTSGSLLSPFSESNTLTLSSGGFVFFSTRHRNN